MAASRDYPGCQLVTVAMREVAFKRTVREGEEIFSTEVTLVRVDGKGRKQSFPKCQ